MIEFNSVNSSYDFKDIYSVANLKSFAYPNFVVEKDRFYKTDGKRIHIVYKSLSKHIEIGGYGIVKCLKKSVLVEKTDIVMGIEDKINRMVSIEGLPSIKIKSENFNTFVRKLYSKIPHCFNVDYLKDCYNFIESESIEVHYSNEYFKPTIFMHQKKTCALMGMKM